MTFNPRKRLDLSAAPLHMQQAGTDIAHVPHISAGVLLILGASDLHPKSPNAPSELLYRQSNMLYTSWCTLSFRTLPGREGRQDDRRQSKLTARRVFRLPKLVPPPDTAGRAAPDCELCSESSMRLRHCWVRNRCAIPRAFSNLVFFYIWCVHRLTFCKSNLADQSSFGATCFRVWKKNYCCSGEA